MSLEMWMKLSRMLTSYVLSFEWICLFIYHSNMYKTIRIRALFVLIWNYFIDNYFFRKNSSENLISKSSETDGAIFGEFFPCSKFVVFFFAYVLEDSED